ncbi:NAD(P)H-hydrate dehydratase [Candidatus Daviesbacteria bacterium]|nr:NAD(P)H-hydrate dehydratase [Candidatus Daviesbacteria bacterium]
MSLPKLKCQNNVIAVNELTKKQVIGKLPKRPRDANKGTFGKVLVFAGSENYPGAAYLACEAVYRVGAGLVTLATIPEVKIIVSRKLPEVTFLSSSESFKKLKEFDVVLLGPGLGQSKQSINLIYRLLKEKLPKIIIDGDGLNLLSRIEKWWDKLGDETILTPHPGEMFRLTGLSIEQIQSDRENIAKQFAKKWNKIIVLKGANTVIVSPGRGVTVAPFANPLLATAGTGDVLSGAIAGFTAQGLKLLDAAACGVYIHGLAGETLKERFGNTGLLASDLLLVLPKVIKQLSSY